MIKNCDSAKDLNCESLNDPDVKSEFKNDYKIEEISLEFK